jgi:hypothetical protein
MAKLIEKRQERNGTWTVRVANDAETRSVFLSFKTEPTKTQVRDAFDAMIAAEKAAREAAEAEREAEEGTKVTLRDAIRRYEAGKLTNVQSRQLLDAMIARARKLDLI